MLLTRKLRQEKHLAIPSRIALYSLSAAQGILLEREGGNGGQRERGREKKKVKRKKNGLTTHRARSGGGGVLIGPCSHVPMYHAQLQCQWNWKIKPWKIGGLLSTPSRVPDSWVRGSRQGLCSVCLCSSVVLEVELKGCGLEGAAGGRKP